MLALEPRPRMIPPTFLAHHVAPPPPLWPPGLFGFGVVVLLWGLYRRAYRGRTPSGASGDEDWGTVYVLTNPAHEHLVKIGYTTRSARTRAKELSSATGVPGDFSVAYETATPTPKAVEQAVHNRLSDHKVKRNREFFEVSPQTARNAIDAERGSHVSGGTRGLGWALLVAALLAGLSLITYHPTDLPSGHSASAWDLLTMNSRETGVDNLLGRPGAGIASVCVRHGFGYLTLFPLGLTGMFGFALVRARPLRPLVGPGALVLCAVVATAGGLGGLVSSASAVPVGWNGTLPPPSGLDLWIGGGGHALADGLRAVAGPGGALLFVLATAGLCLVLLVYWARLS